MPLNVNAPELPSPVKVPTIVEVSVAPVAVSVATIVLVTSAVKVPGGVPPAEFVLQKRMQRATKLLTNATFLPVKEVAIMTGFDDANYFSKVFRRIYGASPTEFRTTGMYASLSTRASGSGES